MNDSLANFDRNLQFELLELAVYDYPDVVETENIPDHLRLVDKKKLLQNIAYLQEEGMIEGGILEFLSGKEPAIHLIKATKDAINLLTEEGSISASLKIVTVKLHNESLSVIREFIQQNVNDSEEKKLFLQQIKQLPADATKHIVLELLGKGLNQMPNAIQWLQTVLHLG
ncbi:MAG TPA: hypothetical protein ACHBY4_15340 [Arsenophonus apicola]|uniref:hypothetical protein n=1 Tax=Arsenophonus apicola TaxID=2879119 RepID=UPI00387965EF